MLLSRVIHGHAKALLPVIAAGNIVLAMALDCQNESMGLKVDIVHTAL